MIQFISQIYGLQLACSVTTWSAWYSLATRLLAYIQYQHARVLISGQSVIPMLQLYYITNILIQQPWCCGIQLPLSLSTLVYWMVYGLTIRKAMASTKI